MKALCIIDFPNIPDGSSEIVTELQTMIDDYCDNNPDSEVKITIKEILEN